MSLPQNVAEVLPWPVLVTHSLPLFSFVLFWEIIQKWPQMNTLLLFFIFCRRVSLFAVTILSVIACITWLSLVFGKVTGDKSSKDFVKHDLVLVICCSLTRQHVTCHTSRFVRHAPGCCEGAAVHSLHTVWFQRWDLPYPQHHHTPLLNTRESFFSFCHMFGHFILSSEPPCLQGDALWLFLSWMMLKHTTT